MKSFSLTSQLESTGRHGKSNQGQNRIAGFVSRCRCAWCAAVCARAARKILGERQRIPALGGAGVCFGGGAALILRYPRPASSFVSLRTRTLQLVHSSYTAVYELVAKQVETARAP